MNVFGPEYERQTANALIALVLIAFAIGISVGIGGCSLVNSGWLPTIRVEWSASNDK